MWRQSTNGYADAAATAKLNRDDSRSDRPATSIKNIKSKFSIGYRTLAISQDEDDPQIRKKYRTFILDAEAENDWVNDLELDAVLDMADRDLRERKKRLKVLVIYGSLRRRSVPRVLQHAECCHEGWLTQEYCTNLLCCRSYSRFVALEASRILFRLGCDVRVYDPNGLPVKDDVQHTHEKVQELRELSTWSDGHVWISPEQHGNLVRIDVFFFLPTLFAATYRTVIFAAPNLANDHYRERYGS